MYASCAYLRRHKHSSERYMILISKKSFNKITSELDLVFRIMSIAKEGVYGREELLVSISGNRIVIFEKTLMQKRFESWLSQTRSPAGLSQKEACGHLERNPTTSLKNEKRCGERND